MKAGVVGAGAAGLAAAYDLTRAGHDVVVFESAPFMGGQASTILVAGRPLERGYHHLFMSDEAILDLLGELKIADVMEWYPSNVGTWVNGELHRTTTALDLLQFRAMPLFERIRMGLFTLRLKRMKNWDALESFTADEWLREHLGGKAYDVVWNPLLRGKFGRFHDQVGMPWLWSKFHTRFASRDGLLSRELLGYPTGSFDVIFDKLSEEIRNGGGEIRLSTPVDKIAPAAGDGLVEIRAGGGLAGAGSGEEFDCVLMTVPSFAVPGILDDIPLSYLSRLESVKYLAAVVVILELDRPLTEFYWVNIADDDVPFLGIIEHTNMLHPQLYHDRHLVYLTNYLDRDDRLFSLSRDELVKEYLGHLHLFNRGFRASWVKEVHYNAVSAAQPVMGANYSERKPSHRTPFERVYLANTTQIYPEDRGTNYSIRMGREVAAMMMNDHRCGWSAWIAN